MKTISIKELHERTGQWLRRVREEGELIVTKRGTPIARLPARPTGGTQPLGEAPAPARGGETDRPPHRRTRQRRGDLRHARRPVTYALDPVTNGVRVLIDDANANVLDTIIPGGAFDANARMGWKTGEPVSPAASPAA